MRSSLVGRLILIATILAMPGVAYSQEATLTGTVQHKHTKRDVGEIAWAIPGVQDVNVDTKRERVIVTFDARKTHPPDLHDAILKSGYKPAPFAE